MVYCPPAWEQKLHEMYSEYPSFELFFLLVKHSFEIPILLLFSYRAMFFTEIAMYDITLVSQQRALIALGSILNAMEGIDCSLSEEESSVVKSIETSFDTSFQEEEINDMQNRLWCIYRMTSQYTVAFHAFHEPEENKLVSKDLSSEIANSPTCVSST